MNIHRLIEIALAVTGGDRVEIVDLEPAEVATESVVGLSAIISQLVHNATELASEKAEKVVVSGMVMPGGYSLLVNDRGMGMSDEFLEGINLILANSGDSDVGSATSGVRLVAGLAARHGIGVRLEHAEPGVAARVSIPRRLLEDGTPAMADPFEVSSEVPVAGPETALEIELEPEPEPESALQIELEPEPEPILARSKPVAIDTETFLETIFGPLRDAAAAVVVAESEVVDLGPAPEVASPVLPEEPETPEALTGYRRATLRTRIPGLSFNESAPAPSQTNPGEAAVEIKLALTDFTRGRQAAARSGEEDST